MNIITNFTLENLHNYIKIYPEKTISKLSSLKNTNDILLEYYDYIDWDEITKNPHTIDILEDNQDKINWRLIYKNKNAYHIIRKNLDKVIWNEVCLIHSKEACDLLKENQDKINWIRLSANSMAIDILKENEDKIFWDLLSKNINALEIIKRNPDKVNWSIICRRTDCISFIEDNIDKVIWEILELNPSAEYLLEKYNKKKKFNNEVGAVNLLNNIDKIDWCEMVYDQKAYMVLQYIPYMFQYLYLHFVPEEYFIEKMYYLK